MQNIPRPEHPLPQMQRSEWLNLNGTWEFAETDDDNARFLGSETYPDTITVPFCRESRLSGLGRTGFVRNVWYRRKFSVPQGWKSRRVRLHIGACDWKTTVWLNGVLMGEHIGGNTMFTFDITDFLAEGENTLVVHAFDNTHVGNQALGKQSPELESHGCVYTRTTGIWQTVWLEGVGSSYISDFRLEPDPANSRMLLQVEVDGPCDGLKVVAEASSEGKVVGKVETPADWRNARLVLDLSEKRLWSIEDPFLYDLKLTLVGPDGVVDQVDSYFGLRDVSIKGAAVLINGKPVFQRTVLDQGFYPDGIWTAPSEEALKHDIEISQAAGFNGARLHQKVFEPRFLYWADRMGYIVWGEFPNWGLGEEAYLGHLYAAKEWVEIMRRDRNHPSIIGWCPFNETADPLKDVQNAVVEATRAIDPSRPVIDTSGWRHSIQNPDILDEHDYDQDVASFRSRWTDAFEADSLLCECYNSYKLKKLTPFFLSEYGGIAWSLDEKGWGYGNTPKSEEEFLSRYEGLTKDLLDNPLIFGFCYTQLYDIEQEQNGLYYYDRTPKFDMNIIKGFTSRPAASEANPVYDAPKTKWDQRLFIGHTSVPAAKSGWRYAVVEPTEGWAAPDFDDSSWKTGSSTDDWSYREGSDWHDGPVLLRQEFEFDGGGVAKAMAAAYNRVDSIYLNGELIWHHTGWSDRYRGFDVTEAVAKAIKPGRNVVATSIRKYESQTYPGALLVIAKK